MMARDPGLAEQVEQLAGGCTAAAAVYEAFGVYRKLLGGAGEYMAARIADLTTSATWWSRGCWGWPCLSPLILPAPGAQRRRAGYPPSDSRSLAR
jgi:hypothetical protein